MTSRTFSFGVWTMVVVAILLWTGFGLLVWKLGEERVRAVTQTADAVTMRERERVAGELSTLLRDTRAEREALDQLTSTDVLAAAATIESAGKAAGVKVSIEGASNQINGPQVAGFRTVVVIADAEGKISSLLKAAQLFESLTFPSLIESYELIADPIISGKGSTGLWRMTTRIRILIPAETGV